MGGVENKSSMGSMLIAKGEECLDGWVRAGGGEVKGGGVDFRVTKSLLVLPVLFSVASSVQCCRFCLQNRTGIEKPMELLQ
ncbi:hypothetical protein Tco_0083379 [Tanacetum coccineum]